MQIKPAYKEYKELWREKVCVDDTNIQYDLVCFKAKRSSKGIAKLKIKNYRVLSNKLTYFNNGATAYSSEAYFRNRNFVLGGYYNPIRKRGFDIYPVFAGSTAIIENGIRIYFIVRKLTITEKIKSLFYKLCTPLYQRIYWKLYSMLYNYGTHKNTKNRIRNI